MALKFYLDEVDGMPFKRFSRNLSIESWVVAVDEDNPPPEGPRYSAVVRFDPYNGGLFTQESIVMFARRLMEAVNHIEKLHEQPEFEEEDN